MRRIEKTKKQKRSTLGVPLDQHIQIMYTHSSRVQCQGPQLMASPSLSPLPTSIILLNKLTI